METITNTTIESIRSLTSIPSIPSIDKTTEYITFETIAPILCTMLTTGLLIYIDNVLKPRKGRYYIVHSLANACITALSIQDVISIYKNPYASMDDSSTALWSSSITYSVHFYHFASYYKTFRFDDWLHHILMIFVALPLAGYFGSLKLLSHSLFYTTGLPGMIDYALLFLVRNNKIQRFTEKSVNRLLNIVIRCPGCVIHSYLTLILVQEVTNPVEQYIGTITGLLVYWNGIYFMDQVVGNYYIVAKEQQETKTN